MVHLVLNNEIIFLERGHVWPYNETREAWKLEEYGSPVLGWYGECRKHHSSCPESRNTALGHITAERSLVPTALEEECKEGGAAETRGKPGNAGILLAEE